MDDVLTGLKLSRADYQVLEEACGAPSALPGWAAWNKFQIQAAGRALKRGEWPEPWTLDMGEFLGWCRRVGFSPCMEGLKVYADVRCGRGRRLQ